MSESKALDKSASNDEPFRFLDLPAEVQIMIYECHYADSDPVMWAYDKKTGHIKFHGIPNLHLEQSCRKISVDARAIRNKKMSTRVGVLVGLGIDDQGLKDFCTLDRCSWLRQHISEMEVRTLKLHHAPDWDQVVGSFPKLEELTIAIVSVFFDNMCPEHTDVESDTCNYFQEALEGEYDDMAIDLAEEMKIDDLYRILSARTEDPWVDVSVHAVRVFVNAETDLMEPCIEARTELDTASEGFAVDSRHCHSKYAQGYREPDMEEAEIEKHPEPTTVHMNATRRILQTKRADWGFNSDEVAG